MTVGQALERAEELRPGCKVDSRTRQRWLCEEDGMLRALLFSGCGLRAGASLYHRRGCCRAVQLSVRAVLPGRRVYCGGALLY